MSRRGYCLRMALYILLAVLPVIKDGIQQHTLSVIVALTAVYEAALAIKAFIDKSPSLRDAQKAVENADAKNDNTATPAS